MVIHTGTRTSYGIFASEIQKHLSTAACKHGVIIKWKYKKRTSTRKLTEREYHVHNDADVVQKYVNKFCNTNQFTPLPFCVSHTKPHGARGLSKHSHMRFDPKLEHVIFTILHITCAYAECKYMLNKPWIIGLTPKQQPRYQPVNDCSYWPVVGYLTAEI